MRIPPNPTLKSKTELYLDKKKKEQQNIKDKEKKFKDTENRRVSYRRRPKW